MPRGASCVQEADVRRSPAPAPGVGAEPVTTLERAPAVKLSPGVHQLHLINWVPQKRAVG